MGKIIDKDLVRNLATKNLYVWSRYAESESDFLVAGKFSSLVFEGSAATPDQASETITLSRGSGTQNAYVKYYANGLGYSKSGANSTVYSHSLNAQDVEFNTVYGGAVMSAKENGISVNAKSTSSSITSFGDVSITLVDSKVKEIYGGGAGVGSVMQGDVSISLSNVNVGTVYGGGYKSVVNGNVEIVVDSKTANKVGNIYVGGYNGTVTGNANVRFTATNDISAFRKTIYGIGRGGKSVLGGESTLCLADVRGNFNGKLKNFDNVVIEGNSVLNFTQGQDKSMRETTYQFIVNNDTLRNSSGAAMLTWNKAVQLNNVQIKLDVTDYANIEKGLTIISSRKFTTANSFDVDVVTVFNSEGKQLYSGLYEINYAVYDKSTKSGGTVTLTYKTDINIAENTSLSETLVTTNANEFLTIADGVTFRGNIDLFDGKDTLTVKEGAVVSGLIMTGRGDDSVFLGEGSSVTGSVDLGEGSDNLVINGYLGGLKLGSGENTVVINGRLNADNVQIDDNSVNTFTLKGKLAADAHGEQAAQQFVACNGSNTLTVDSNDGVSGIVMGGEFAKVIITDAAGFDSTKSIDLSAAKSSVLEIKGDVAKFDFQGSAEDSTVLFSGDTTIAMDSLMGFKNGSKLVVADGVKVTVTDCDESRMADLDLQLGTHSMVEGANFILLGEKFSGTIGSGIGARVEKDVHATDLADAAVYTSGKFVASGTVSDSRIAAKELVLDNAVIDNNTVVIDVDKVSAVSGKNAFNGALVETDDSKRIPADLAELSVSPDAGLTIGTDAELGNVAVMYAAAGSDVTLDQVVKIDTLNVYGDGDFDVKGAKPDVGTVHFGCTVNDEFVAFNGNVDKLFDVIEQANLTVVATDSVLKFSKDADLTENLLAGTKYELTDTTLELADGVTVTLEKKYDTAAGSQSVSARLINTFGVKGGTVVGDLLVVEAADDRPALTLEDAVVNGNVGAIDTQAGKVAVEGSCTVSGYMDVEQVVSGEKDGALKVDTITATIFGAKDTVSEFTVAIDANKVIARESAVELYDNVSLTVQEYVTDSVLVKGDAELNASVDAEITVCSDAVLGGAITMVEDNVKDLGKHNINLLADAELNGTVSGNVVLQDDASIGAALTGNVNCLGNQLNLADKAEIKGLVSDFEKIFVKDGSATVEDIGEDNIDRVFGNLTVTKTVTDTRAKIVFGRTPVGKDPADNALLTFSQSLELEKESVMLEAASGTKDSISGQVNAEDKLVLQSEDEFATLTLSDVKAKDLVIGANVDITHEAAAKKITFGGNDITSGLLTAPTISGSLLFEDEGGTLVLADKKATVSDGVRFNNNQTVELQVEDAVLDANISALYVESKKLAVKTAGNAELGVIDMGKALDENEYAHDPYVQAGLNVIDIDKLADENDMATVTVAGIKSEGNLKIDVSDNRTLAVTDTIVHEKILTLTGDIEANVSANSMNLGYAVKDDMGEIVELIGVNIKGTVAGKTVTVNDAEINGTLAIETSLYLNGDLAVVDANGDAAAINGDFSLMTSGKSITGNLTGSITLGDNLNLIGDLNSLVAEQASRWVKEITDNNTIDVSGNAAAINLGEGTDFFTAATLGSLTSGSGTKTVAVKKGSTDAIDLSNADSSTVMLGDGLQAVEFGTVAGSKGGDTVVITPVTEFVHDEFYTITGLTNSSFAGFDFSAITDDVARGVADAAEDLLTNAGNAAADVSDVKFVNLKITGRQGFTGDFFGADHDISARTSIAPVAQQSQSIGDYGPIATPADSVVGISRDVLTVSANITGKVSMGKGADMLVVDNSRTINDIDFGTSLDLSSYEQDVAEKLKAYDFDALTATGTLKTNSIDFSGNLHIAASAITYGSSPASTIASSVNAASAECVSAYGKDPSKPAWTSQTYTVEVEDRQSGTKSTLGELAFRFNDDNTAVVSAEFTATAGLYDVIKGKTENGELTIRDNDLTVTGSVSLAKGSTLNLNKDLTLKGFGGKVVSAYAWKNGEFASSASIDITYTNVGTLDFSETGSIVFAGDGDKLTANAINAANSVDLTATGKVEVNAAINADTINLKGESGNFQMSTLSNVVNSVHVDEGVTFGFSGSEIVELDTNLYLDWMDADGETFSMNEGVSILDISKVLADTKLYAGNGDELVFAKTSDTTGVFKTDGYQVLAEVDTSNDKSINFKYATVAPN